MMLDGLTEEQARRRLVPSSTTLLGLLKHVTWKQRVWFEECVGGTSRRRLGPAQTIASPGLFGQALAQQAHPDG
jgi:hypothetical protein